MKIYFLIFLHRRVSAGRSIPLAGAGSWLHPARAADTRAINNILGFILISGNAREGQCRVMGEGCQHCDTGRAAIAGKDPASPEEKTQDNAIPRHAPAAKMRTPAARRKSR